MTVLLSQEGSSCTLPVSVVSYQKTPEILNALYEGTMTLIASYWSSAAMGWLDGPGSDGATPCVTETCDCGAQGTFSDFSIDGRTDSDVWKFEDPSASSKSKNAGHDQQCIPSEDLDAWFSTVEGRAPGGEGGEAPPAPAPPPEDLAEAGTASQIAARAGIAKACASQDMVSLLSHINDALAAGLPDDEIVEASKTLEKLRMDSPKVIVELVLEGVNFTKMSKALEVQVSFDRALKKSLQLTSQGMANADFIVVLLSPGPNGRDVVAHAEITVPSPHSAQDVLEKLSKWEDLGANVAFQLQSVEGILSISDGVIRLRSVGDPSISRAVPSTPAPTEPKNGEVAEQTMAVVKTFEQVPSKDPSGLVIDWNVAWLLGITIVAITVGGLCAGATYRRYAVERRGQLMLLPSSS
jgi:hypothetical protein